MICGSIPARSRPSGIIEFDGDLGDLILAVDGVPMHEVPLANLFGQNWIGGRFVGRAGERVVLRIRRDGVEQDVPVTLGTRNEITFAIEAMAAPSAEQLAIRRAWLRQ